MTTVQVHFPPKLVEPFSKPRGHYRYILLKGGRGSGKSKNAAMLVALWGYVEPIRILCTRQYMASIKESFYAELKSAILEYPWLEAGYDIGVDYIRGKNGTEIFFRGLDRSMNAIKSLSNIDVCVVEEAEDVSEASWKDLIPTIRKAGSCIIAIWNPKTKGSPVDQRFVQNTPPRSVLIELNYRDNPWFPEVLEEERRAMLASGDHDMYLHVWEGQYLTHSQAQIFRGIYKVKEFEPGNNWNGPYYGLDFGFSQDPTAAAKCWIFQGWLYIEYDAAKVGLELDDTARYLSERIPGIASHTVRADSARPESISYLKRHGLPKIVACTKGPGSIFDGITHIKSYSGVIIHPRCEETQREFRLYSYKVDKLSGDVLNTIEDRDNHIIDALRYALEPVMKKKFTNYKKLV